MNYRGWHIYPGPEHPVTGQWRARRHGVTMGGNTLEMLRSMIDQRHADDAQRFNPCPGAYEKPGHFNAYASTAACAACGREFSYAELAGGGCKIPLHSYQPKSAHEVIA